MEILVALIAALFGLVIYSDTKRKSAEALNENADTKNKLNKIDTSVSKNEGLNQAEEEKRKAIESNLESEKQKVDTLEDINKFFNDNDPK